MSCARSWRRWRGRRPTWSTPSPARWTCCANSRPTCSASPCAARPTPRPPCSARRRSPASPKACGSRRPTRPTRGARRPRSSPCRSPTPIADAPSGARPSTAAAPGSTPISRSSTAICHTVSARAANASEGRMGSGRDGGTTPQPSEPLCELALALAAEIDDYERRGGDDIVRDVVMREPYAALFDASASNTGRTRPGWRWDIVLRHGAHAEVVVGTPNGAWHVETIALLRGLAQHHEQGAVLVDVDAADESWILPPPDDDSPANRAMAGGFAAG